MSTESKSAEAFINQLAGDAQLRDEVERLAGTPGALTGFLKAKGYDFTKAEFEAAMRSKAGITEHGEISQEALEAMSGGSLAIKGFYSQAWPKQEFPGANPGEVVVIHPD